MRPVSIAMDIHLDLNKETEKRLKNYKDWIDESQKQRKYKCDCGAKLDKMSSSSSQTTAKDYSMKSLNKYK